MTAMPNHRQGHIDVGLYTTRTAGRDYWRAMWRDPSTGRQRARGLGSTEKVSKRAATTLAKDIEVQLNRSARAAQIAAQADRRAPTIAEAIERHLALHPGLGPATRRRFSTVKRRLAEHFDDLPIDRMTPDLIAQWHAAELRRDAVWSTSPTRGPSRPAARVSPATVAKYASTAHAAVTTAIRTGRAGRLTSRDDNPFAELPKSVKAGRDWREVTAADIAAIVADTTARRGGARWARLIMLCRWCGLRLGEATSLTWGDVALSANTLKVHARARTNTTKARLRLCPIEAAKAPTGMLDAVRLWQIVDGRHGPHGSVSIDPTRLVIAGPEGLGVPAKATRNIRPILKRSGVGVFDRPFHTLRKCRQTELHAAGYSDMTVTDWMGNSGQVAREHYYRSGADVMAAPLGSTIGSGIGSGIGGPKVDDRRADRVYRLAARVARSLSEQERALLRTLLV